MAEFKVEIGADIKDFESKLNKATSELNNFGTKADKNLGKFSKASDSASKSAKGLSKGVVSGNSAMTAFSRTVQDAPFGIMGVSNNITNLTEQFGYLKNKTGSAKGALSAMLRDLKGFGGISLAISVATSLMLVFNDEIKKAFKTSNKLTDAIKKSSENIGVEINKLTLLTKSLKDENTSKETKLKIIKELNKKYPKHFGFLDNEKINVNKVTAAYKLQKRAIIGLGVTKALEAQKAPEYAKLAELELKKASELLTAADKIFLTSGALTFEQMTSYTRELAKESKDRQVAEIEKNIAKIDKAAEKIKGRFGISLDDVLGLKEGGETDKKINTEIQSVFSTLKNSYVNEIQGFNEVAATLPIDILGAGLTQFDIDALLFKTKLEGLNQDITQTLANGTQSAFAGFGQAIGEAFATGGNVLDAVGSSLLSTLGGILVELGQMAIAVGIGIKGVKLALESLNPVAAIAAGVALVAIGSAFSSGASNLANGGSSGSNASSSSGSSSFSGGSSSSSVSGSSGGTYVFEIAGTKLVGVLSNTLRKNKNLGGSLSLT